MKKIYCLLVLLWPMFLHAQNNFQKGYVITLTNDTLQGYVNYKEGINNYQSVEFRSTVNGKTDYYSAKDILNYSIIQGADKIHYDSYKVKISTSTERLNELSVGIDTSTTIKHVFLKLIRGGEYVMLYQYEDEIKSRFYIKENAENKALELIRSIYAPEDDFGKMLERKTYLNQLNVLLSRYNLEAFSKSFVPEYTSQDLAQFVAMINKENVKKISGNTFTFYYVGLGVSSSKGKYSGQHPLAHETTTTPSPILPSINFGFITAKSNISATFLKIELMLLAGKYDILRNQVERHRFQQYTLGFSPQYFFNVYNKQNTKVYIGAGIGLNASIYSNNLAEFLTPLNSVLGTHDLNMQIFSFSFPLSTGIRIHKNFDLLAIYHPYTSITDYHKFSLAISRYRFGVNYLIR
jgi:hypothetical protein